MAHFAYHTLDVFTDRPLAGNPLAVVHDADDLDASAMQAIAREMNLSETVFVMAPRNPMHNARIRIFTPARELPFAGHPTVGAAVVLAETKFGRAEAREAIVVLEEEIGPVRCGVRIAPGKASYAEFDVPRLAEEAGRAGTRERIGAALGLLPSDVGFDNHKPTVYSAGVEFTLVPVRDRDALHRSQPIGAAWKDAFSTGGVYLYTRLPAANGRAYRARMYGQGLGIVEDPATGSAAAAFAGAVARFESLADGQHTLPIEQGVEMGRPSLITLEVSIAAGRLAGARIGGGALVVCEGRLTI
jgi:trans-2,3-dihydro-3-hydroxyanthranilate isomerase